jgi:tRNA (guanine-N7-)-methyltransferase
MPIEQAHALRHARIEALRPRLAALLQGNRHLTLEVGCGHGHFLTAFATAHADEFCLAIDLIAERLERAGRKSDRLGLTNIAWVQAEAADLLQAWPDGVQIDRSIFVLFPDPWPKRRHWKNRLVQGPFLTALAARTAPGARLYFRTDHAPYFATGLAALREHSDWVVLDDAPWPFETATVFQTRASGFQSVVAARR